MHLRRMVYLCMIQLIGIQFIKQGGLNKLRTADKAGIAVVDDRGRKMERTAAFFADASPDSTESTSNSESPSRGSETTPPSPPLSAFDYKQDTKPPLDAPPLHMLFLGSSLGNFSRPDMASFLLQLPLRPGSGDNLLLGLDGDNGKELVERAYDDSKGITRAFVMNGLLGRELVTFVVLLLNPQVIQALEKLLEMNPYLPKANGSMSTGMTRRNVSPLTFQRSAFH